MNTLMDMFKDDRNEQESLALHEQARILRQQMQSLAAELDETREMLEDANQENHELKKLANDTSVEDDADRWAARAQEAEEVVAMLARSGDLSGYDNEFRARIVRIQTRYNTLLAERASRTRTTQKALSAP